MKFSKLSFVPSNPKHFLALCFMELKTHPELAKTHNYMKLELEYKNWGLFSCAYGYFWQSKSKKLSTKFYLTKKDALLRKTS